MSEKYLWKDELNFRLVDEKTEEKKSKIKVLEMYDKNLFSKIEIGTFKGLQEIHKTLFEGIFSNAGELRKHEISKGDFRFARVMYSKENLKIISKLPEDTFEQIVEKYVEMNIMHPFYEGNGRAMRLWLDQMLINRLNFCIDWSKIDREEYMSAMKRAPVNSLELRTLLRENITYEVNNREIFMRNIDQSYKYELQSHFKTSQIK